MVSVELTWFERLLAKNGKPSKESEIADLQTLVHCGQLRAGTVSVQQLRDIHDQWVRCFPFGLQDAKPGLRLGCCV
jgi:hypothetical protein